MIEIQIVTIDKPMAMKLLATNVKNRPTKKQAIARYTEDMTNGNWKMTAEPIKVDIEGRLLDGQNRLYALIRACELSGRDDITFTTLLVTGLESESQDYMDSGVTRNLADQLGMRDFKDYSMVAGVAHLMVEYESGNLIGNENNYRSHNIMYYLQWVLDHPEVVDALKYIGSCKDVDLNRPPVTAAYMIISQVCQSEGIVDDFFQSLLNGTYLGDGSPVKALRDRARKVDKAREKFPNRLQLICILRCWNADREGRTMGLFPLRTHNGQALAVPTQILP